MVLDAFRARLSSIIGGFDAAQSHRRMRGFRATRAHVNTLIAASGETITARARWLVRNNGYAANAVDAFANHVVGDPSGPRLWSDLDGVLNGTYGDLPVRAVAVDTGGHHTKMAYEFCRTRLARRIWAIKGHGGPGIPVWPRRPTRTNKGRIPLFIVGVDAVKDAVYARLKLTEPGPGAIHFHRRLNADYFRQLTAERVVTRFEKGRPIRSWQPKRDGERNEALDTFVYAHAALHGLISMGMRLNEEAERISGQAEVPKITNQSVIRSPWISSPGQSMG